MLSSVFVAQTSSVTHFGMEERSKVDQGSQWDIYLQIFLFQPQQLARVSTLVIIQ